LDGGAPFYSIYETKDRKHIAIGSFEPQFFKAFVKQLPIDEDEKKQMIKNQMNQEEWPKMKEQLQKIFSKETSAQWKEKYKG